MYAVLDPLLPPAGRALELGAGVGTGVRHLLERGLTVTAVDAEPEAIRHLRQRCPDAEIIEARMQDLELGEAKWDVVVAGFALFFLERAEVEALWQRMLRSLKSGGLFMGQFLGVHDDWAAQGYTAHTTDEVAHLLAPLQLVFLEEAERDGKTSQGTTKHWHVYHVLARKP